MCQGNAQIGRELGAVGRVLPRKGGYHERNGYARPRFGLHVGAPGVMIEGAASTPRAERRTAPCETARARRPCEMGRRRRWPSNQ